MYLYKHKVYVYLIRLKCLGHNTQRCLQNIGILENPLRYLFDDR